jgi:hypothetical protein
VSETPSEPKEFPACTCGHDAVEHNHSPSGCGTTHCQHDADGDTGLSYCPCREYEPDEPCFGCGHLLSDHEPTDSDCLATVHIPPYPERPCDCAEFIDEEEAEYRAAQEWLRSQGALG